MYILAALGLFCRYRGDGVATGEPARHPDDQGPTMSSSTRQAHGSFWEGGFTVSNFAAALRASCSQDQWGLVPLKPTLNLLCRAVPCH